MVVVGAGTEVGKTHFGVTFAHALARAGEQVAALKPIESGVTSGVVTDAARLGAASSPPLDRHPLYAFAEPISPHLAARRTGAVIEVAAAVAWVNECTSPWVLVETAGGLLSPLGHGVTNLDLARALRPDIVILVALDRLGVLHEVSACHLALRTLAGELPTPVVVLQAPTTGDLSTGTNADELVTMGIVPRAFTMPRGESTDPAALAVAERIVRECFT